MADKSSSFFERIKINANPVANSNSLVACGQARFTVLTSRLIRLEWSSTAEFEDRATFAFPGRYAEPPAFSHQYENGQLTIQTDSLSLYYKDNGHPFDPTNLSIEFKLEDRRIKWKPGTVNTHNLRGTRRTLDQCADAADLREGLLSRDGWALVNDSGLPVWTVDQHWIEARPDTHIQDWYFFGYGHDYKAALQDYVQFGGPIPLIPRYVLGLWWSRFWAYSADDLAQLVDDFKEHEIPLDVLVVDMDWHTPDGWTGYTWNRELFPDPVAFLAQMHAQNLHVTLNLHPAEGIQQHEEAYPQFAERLGQDPALAEGIKFNSTSEAFVQNYFELLHYPMEDQGVDFWWLDWQQGESSGIKNLDPLLWLNHLHFQDATRRGIRPMLYSRWGGLGNHRYPIGFSGDTYATWESLRFQPYFTATAANVCYGWWSHDIGGHFGATDPELYARWVQFGAVSTCLRLHSTKDPLAERRPWGFSPEIYHAAKEAIQLRYRLLPYLYSAARNLSGQGLSLCYPMYYEYPDIEDAYLARSQYFLGDQLFTAPFVSPIDPKTGLASVDIWIPDGAWREFSTDEIFTGPQWVRIYGDLNRIPMFVKSGGIVPTAQQIMRTKEFDGAHLVLNIFAGADGAFDLYEDDDATDAYKHGEYEITSIQSSLLDDQTIEISIADAKGHCRTLPAKRTFELHLKGINRPDQITANGSKLTDWSYDPKTCELVIILTGTDRYMPLNIVVKTDELINALDGGHIDRTTSGPFVHFIDYETFADASQQLGSLIVVPPDNNSRFDVEIEWKLQKGDTLISKPLTLKDCRDRQIIYSPFNDDGSMIAFRWSADVDVQWHDQQFHDSYQSQAAYPGLNQWQTLIYNREEQPHSGQDVMLADNTINPALPWSIGRQTVNSTPNLKQPFGLVLLEHERNRILSGEALEACVTTTLISQSAQEVILCVHHVGDQTCYFNGVELQPIEPIEHDKLQPMFYSWMPQSLTYFTLPLQKGSNRLVFFTRPNSSIGWWGIGATVFDKAGQVMVFPFYATE
jgi:alpha-glucosidase